MSACFLWPLDVVLTDEASGTWVLDHALVYFSEIIGGQITVPKGIATDFASVPRIPIVYLLYANRGRKAAVVHDFMYRTKMATRAVCDAVFREALIADGESLAVSWAMWAGVRIGGLFAYQGRARG